MGQAKNRGTFEQRRDAAVVRNAEAAARGAEEVERQKKVQEIQRIAQAEYRRDFTIAALIATAPAPKTDIGT